MGKYDDLIFTIPQEHHSWYGFVAPRGFFRAGAMRANVMVEAEVRTREERVDMDADSTSTITIPMMMAGRLESIRGMTASNPSAFTSMS